jgi:hypothetical protein
MGASRNASATVCSATWGRSCVERPVGTARCEQRGYGASVGTLGEPFETDRRLGEGQGGGVVALGERWLGRIDEGTAHTPALGAAQAPGDRVPSRMASGSNREAATAARFVRCGVMTVPSRRSTPRYARPLRSPTAEMPNLLPDRARAG